MAGEIIDKKRAVEILGNLASETQAVLGELPSSVRFVRWRRGVSVATEKIFGKDSDQLREVQSVSYDLPIIHEGTTDSDFIQYSNSGVAHARALLESMVEEVLEYWPDPKPPGPEPPEGPPATRSPAEPKPTTQKRPRSMTKNIPDGWKATGRQLGEGAHARVQVVTSAQSQDGKLYALKVLKSNLPPRTLTRFYQEIEAVKKLSHPTIIRIIEHSNQGAAFDYYVMEYVDGARSLRQLIAAEANPFFRNPAKSVEMFIALLEALGCCEQAGVIHRDLSPANILVQPDGRIKVIDFGLCQVEGGHRHTLTDENIGTPNYLAPECEGFSQAETSIRSDLYSAGKILWSAMTNKVAFAREDRAFKDLSMRELFPDHESSWHLQHIFEKTIRHDIKNRWMSSEEAIKESRHVLELIRSNTLPIEALLANRCPTCRHGTLRDPEKVISVGGYTLFSQGQPRGVVRLICNHCGYCHLIYRELQGKTVQERREFS